MYMYTLLESVLCQCCCVTGGLNLLCAVVTEWIHDKESLPTTCVFQPDFLDPVLHQIRIHPSFLLHCHDPSPWHAEILQFPLSLENHEWCSIDPSALAARTTGLQFQEKVLRSLASTLSQENQLWSGSWNFLPEATSWKAGFSKSHHNSKRFTIYFLEKQLQPIYYQNDSLTRHDLT